ncbi:unnamed protein product [Rotaria magnacalcarata]|uniref:Uncharacterized protein n=1 Tax=Rotaria magnacalcarata TaxID=392030 RepID=A0A816N7U6_9BILA|nr:unnamed protein product [Rotaria magnacalcarata]
MSSATTEHSPPPATETIQTNIEQSTDELPNLVDGRDKPLVIILAVTLPTLAFIGILIIFIVCYRRRNSSVWLKKIEHSSRLQAIVVNLSSSSIQTEYPEKKTRTSHRQFSPPRTETIVYNRLSTPSSPVFINSFNRLQSSNEGETNEAFDEYLIKNEQQPVLRSILQQSSTNGQHISHHRETNEAFDEYLIKNEQQPVLRSILQQSSTNGQHISSLQTDFPVKLQAPVRTITSALVEAIATHRISLFLDETNASSSLETTTTNNHNDRHSGASSSCSNNSQTVLLFSQRTEL